MAATTFSDVPQVKTVTLGTSNTASQFTKPAGANKATVYFDTNPGKLAFTGTDGSAIGAHYMPIPADTLVEVPLVSGAALFLASATASTVVHVSMERE
jgi:hypothetical protein